MLDIDTLDEFTRAYFECALWSETDGEGEALDQEHDITDISDETVADMVADCTKFQSDNAELLTDDNLLRNSEYSVYGAAGHDFWLTRNGHGAGFWDGDWGKVAGEKLTESSKGYKQTDLYIGDDGKIYA